MYLYHITLDGCSIVLIPNIALRRDASILQVSKHSHKFYSSRIFVSADRKVQHSELSKMTHMNKSECFNAKTMYADSSQCVFTCDLLYTRYASFDQDVMEFSLSYVINNSTDTGGSRQIPFNHPSAESSTGLSSGSIVAIVLSLLAVVPGSAYVSYYFSRKKKLEIRNASSLKLSILYKEYE